MKYFKTFEGFKKEYMTKIDLKDFKKIKKGTKLTYMGGPAEVMDNNGYVLTLKGEDDKTFTVNKSQFDHGGFIKESVNEAQFKVGDNVIVMRKDGKEYTGKVEKLNPLKLRISPSDTIVIPNAYIKDIVVNEGKLTEAKSDEVEIDIDFAGSKADLRKLSKKYNIEADEYEPGMVMLKGDKKDILAYLTSPQYDMDMSDIEDLFPELLESTVNEEVYIPSNIEEFAKRRGVLPLVKKIGRWAEKAGKRINGGTAIGKGYSTLILDLKHQGGEIRINLDNDEVTLHGTIIDDPKSFKKALKESESINEGDMDSVKKDIMDHWFELYGEKFINEYPAVAKILKQRKNIDRREFARIWDATYGEDFKEKYPAMWDKLD